MFEDRGTRCVRLICVPDILDCGGAKPLTDEPEMLSSNVKSSIGCDGVILIMPIAPLVLVVDADPWTIIPLCFVFQNAGARSGFTRMFFAPKCALLQRRLGTCEMEVDSTFF